MAALVADGANALAGAYISYSEGDNGPLKSSAIGFLASGVAGFGVKSFGGSIAKPFPGTMVTKAPSKTSVGAASYGAGQAGGNIGQQRCN